jgi:hypothetical protein
MLFVSVTPILGGDLLAQYLTILFALDDKFATLLIEKNIRHDNPTKLLDGFCQNIKNPHYFVKLMNMNSHAEAWELGKKYLQIFSYHSYLFKKPLYCANIKAMPFMTKPRSMQSYNNDLSRYWKRY